LRSVEIQPRRKFFFKKNSFPKDRNVISKERASPLCLNKNI
jgi:hypothetical protein